MFSEIDKLIFEHLFNDNVDRLMDSNIFINIYFSPLVVFDQIDNVHNEL